MQNRTLGELRVVDIREVWKNEERDFTPWIADNIARLCEAIGVQFSVDQTEKRVGAYELDIFGRIEGSDAPVIIENQFGPTDHRHLGQLITYAAGLEAAVIIWVAAEVSDEHRDAIEWLNRSTVDSISFFLVRPEVFRIDESKPAVKFVVEASPSEFKRDLRGAVGDAPRHEFRRKFWGELFTFLASKGHEWAKGRQGSKKSWIWSSVGKTGLGVHVSMATGSRMRVEIYCSNDPDKSIFQTLLSRKSEIESLFPEETLSWEPLEDARASRVGVYRAYDKEAVSEDTEARRELFGWIEKNLSRFRRVVGRVLG